MIPIDKDVPLPRRRHGGRGARPAIYPWSRMEPGDSIFVQGRSHLSEVSGAIARAKRTHGHTYTSRVVEGGVRIWRVK